MQKLPLRLVSEHQVEEMISISPSDHQEIKCPTSPISHQDSILLPYQVLPHSITQSFNARPDLMFRKLESLDFLPRRLLSFFPKFLCDAVDQVLDQQMMPSILDH